MRDSIQLLLTKIGIFLGSFTFGLQLADLDLILSLILKSVSIVSFLIVIVINWGTFVEKVKGVFKK